MGWSCYWRLCWDWGRHFIDSFISVDCEFITAKMFIFLREIKMRPNKDIQKKPILAICYGFDKTLSPDDMQSQGYIQSVQCDVKSFWEESNHLAESNQMDQNLAYMYMMGIKARGKRLFNKNSLLEAGEQVKLFPGVKSWFKNINDYGNIHGVNVKHFIISSGLKEMIEGTSIAKEFEAIYASSFYYDSDGAAVWPAQVVNYTSKTQFLFRIEKGALEINDTHVNDFVKSENYTVPFRNMVYIGDSDTDIPCMKLVNSKGGYSIGVFNPGTKDKSKVYKIMHDKRIKFFAPADYSEGKELEILIKSIIDQTESREKLERIYISCLHEMEEYNKGKSENEKERNNLINALGDSKSFKQTHEIVSRLSKYSEWTDLEKKQIISIALTNHQVTYILEDSDIARFFRTICKKDESKEANEVLEKINELT